VKSIARIISIYIPAYIYARKLYWLFFSVFIILVIIIFPLVYSLFPYFSYSLLPYFSYSLLPYFSYSLLPYFFDLHLNDGILMSLLLLKNYWMGTLLFPIILSQFLSVNKVKTKNPVVLVCNLVNSIFLNIKEDGAIIYYNNICFYFCYKDIRR